MDLVYWRRVGCFGNVDFVNDGTAGFARLKIALPRVDITCLNPQESLRRGNHFKMQKHESGSAIPEASYRTIYFAVKYTFANRPSIVHRLERRSVDP